MCDFSILMSVYVNDNPTFLNLSLNSIFSQTLEPTEVVLVKDGPLTLELNTIIKEYEEKYAQLKIVSLSVNMGLGLALNAGLKHCNYEIIARIDADDICYPNRFEKQMAFMLDHPEISVLGSSVQEFNKTPGDLNQFRELPTGSIELSKFSKFRNPINHPSVVFRKSHVLDVGSYQSMLLFEDYYLWIRMQLKGYQIANLNEPLLHFRIGNDMVGRRSGYGYLKKEIAFLTKIKELGFLSNKDYIISILCKSPLRLLPKSILTFIYKKVLR